MKVLVACRASCGVLAACLVGGCPAPIYYQATDGRMLTGSSELDAAFESAQRDLPCDRASISVLASGEASGSWAGGLVPTQLEGCGQHVTYRVTCGRNPTDDHFVCHYALVSRAPATTPAPPSP